MANYSLKIATDELRENEYTYSEFINILSVLKDSTVNDRVYKLLNNVLNNSKHR